MGARSSLRPTTRQSQETVGQDAQHPQQLRAGTARPAGPVLLRTKLLPPPVRTGLIPRARLDALLEAGASPPTGAVPATG
jgi:hypothetical protein